MNKSKESIKLYWYLYLVGILLGIQALVFLIFREESYPQIHDNLDLFMAHYQMLKLNHGFYAHNVNMPMLHGIDRDLLGSEFLLYNALYVIFPGIWAYLIGYALKIAIGIWSFTLLAKDVYKDNYIKYRPIIIVIATAYGLIPVFPTYAIAFTSVPLIIYYLRRLYFTEDLFTLLRLKKLENCKTDDNSSKESQDNNKLATLKKNSYNYKILSRILLYLAVFCYPVFSYFSYHGFFILCYMCVAVIILWIKDKKFPKSTFISIVLLALGYVAFEYRLFKAMLFDDTVTIRTTMNHGQLKFTEALKVAFDEFVNASFHNEDSHTYVVLGVVLLGLVLINIGYIKRKEAKKMLTEPVNLVMGWIIFNVLIFGFYEFEPFRVLVETIVPKLTGFEFARTAYFNTFLWYAELLLVMVKLYDLGFLGKRKFIYLANIIVTAAVVVVMFMPQVYNDFYYTCYNQAFKRIKHKETSTVNYREFYSTKLFDKVKAGIDYDGEWAAAYGLHPAVLQYNGIATVDGYLGMYPEEYKQKWLKIEEPAFINSPSLGSYFEGWGARVSLYSGSDENTYAPLRVMELNDKRLVVNMDELKTLDLKYIISRIEFSNSTEVGIDLIGTFADDSSPYTIYVYEVK